MDTFSTGCLPVWLTLGVGMAVAGADDAVGVELGCGSGGAGPLQLAVHGHAVSTLRRLLCLCAVLADSELRGVWPGARLASAGMALSYCSMRSTLTVSTVRPHSPLVLSALCSLLSALWSSGYLVHNLIALVL